MRSPVISQHRIRANFFAALFLTFLSFVSAVAQNFPAVFDAPWRGFDTGVFGNGFAPSSFVVGDLDGDGDADILVAQSFAGSFSDGGTGVSVLKSNGNRTFTQPTYYPLSQGQTVGEVALSDFDFDGDLDAFATIRGNLHEMLKIKVWRNDGSGTLSAPIEFPTGEGPEGIAVVDVTGDGKPDVVTANVGSSSISVLRHNGSTGASAGFLAPVDFSTGNRAEKIAVGDVNGDGKLDVVVGGGVGTGFAASHAVMINLGTGDFGSASVYDPAPGGRFGSKAVALADLENDGDLDLIGGGMYSSGSVDNGAVTIRRNAGNGTFGAPETTLFDNYIANPKEITTGDINGDGFADIVTAVPSGRTNEGFVAMRSNGTGGFHLQVYYEASQQTFDAAVFDADADGDRDVVTLAQSSAAITVHENPGNGLFRQPTRYTVASLSDAIDSADIDNDGDRDIVVNGEVSIVSSAAVVKILKNTGNGQFAPATDYTPARNFADMKLRDINGDGFVDLVFAPDAGFPPYHAGTALNLGNGTFAPTVVIPVNACGDGTIDTADLDVDGDLDIVLTEELSCIGGAGVRIFVYRNDGNQVFVRMTDIPVPGLPHGLGLADATGDGKIDIISALSGGMGVFPANGNLTFGPPIISIPSPYIFKIADFNGDGKIDIGMIMQQGSFGTDTIATALGNGNGTFQAIRAQTGSSVLENLRISTDIEIADLNRDGIRDVLTFNYASNDMSLFLGNADGSLRPHQRYGICNTPHEGTIGDFDRDGRLDVAATGGLRPSGLQNAVAVVRNAGPSATKAPFDFDGDGKTDVSIFRPSAAEWWINRSSTGVTLAAQFGASTDTITPADYTGDGKTDIGFWRPSTGEWFVLRSEDSSFYAAPFGTSGDVPAPGDFDADGKTDFAVFRPSTGTWFISRSTGGTTIQSFGTNGDIAVPADYDGDRKSDIAIFRPSNGQWWINRSTAGLIAATFGDAADKPVQGDYTGDGKSDVAFWRPATGEWFVWRSEDLSYFSFPFGAAGDVPAPGDYDGDGRYDATVFRPSNSTWYSQRTTAGTLIKQFGANGDRPIPNSFVP